MRTFAKSAFALALVAVGAGYARADIDFTGSYGDLSGTGNGPVLGVLSLQQAGGTDYEYGWSGWNGTNATWSDSTSQNGKSTTPSGYFARSVGELASSGIDETNLALIFQVNVAGQGDTVTIHTFDVVFYNANGTEAGRITYTPDNHSLVGTDIASASVPQTTDNGVLPGVGQGTSGWLYTLDLSGIAASFWDNANNRIGMQVHKYSNTTDDSAGLSGNTLNFNPTNDGADNFWFSTATVAVPLPKSALAGLILLGGVAVLHVTRRRRSQVL
jgi:hypothetical protein